MFTPSLIHNNTLTYRGPPPPFKSAICSWNPPSPVKALTSKKPQEWHLKWIHSSAFSQCRLKSKSRIILRTSERPSERHGTCTHSPSLSPSFERMTATSQRVKNFKLYLAAQRQFFFLPFFSPLSGGTRGSYRHHRICFISLAASALSVVILWRLRMTPPPPPTLCCYFQYKKSIQGLLDASRCLFFRPTARFLLNARQIEHFRNWHFSWSVCQYRAPQAIES